MRKKIAIAERWGPGSAMTPDNAAKRSIASAARRWRVLDDEARALPGRPSQGQDLAVRHARPEDLDRLESLLAELREVHGLREKSRGVFYRGSKAFLHFHEDGSELFADVRIETEFTRLNVTTSRAQKNLLRRVQAVV